MSASFASPDKTRADQLDRLRRRLPEVLASNPFQRERLEAVRTWADFERLPFTRKAEIVADQAATPPFGTNLTYPLDRYTRLHQTSGSSGGSPLRWLDTAESWEWWERCWAEQILPAAGVTAADRVFLAFSFGPFIGFWSAFGGAERLGSLVIAGGAMNTEQRIAAINQLGATVLLGTPTYLLRLAETALAEGLDMSSSGLRTVICAGEPGASIPATRSLLERSFGARVFDHSGMTELGPTGFGCRVGGGLHMIEEEFIFEILDAGGRTASEGEGQLVATNLGRWGSPLVRYCTGDRVRLSREPCECGNPNVRLLGGILGRVDDMVTVRGVNLYPSQVEEIVRRHAEIVEFALELRRVRQMDEVTLLYEVAGPAESLVQRLATELRLALGVRIDCREVAPGTLPRAELKAKRILRAE